MPVIRICQLMDLRMTNGGRIRGQNNFVAQNFVYSGVTYQFIPFQLSGAVMSLGGDNPVMSLLLPNYEIALKLLEAGDGNRDSTLEITQLWLTAGGTPLPNPVKEFYIGIGAGDDDTTAELRFRSAMDSAASQFPRRTLSAENVGILPLDSQISLR